MANVVVVDGVIVRTWRYDGGLRARLAHHGATRGYFNLVFPKTPVVVQETDAQGKAQQRHVALTAPEPYKLCRSQPVIVTGQLVHRDRQVTLSAFLGRAHGSTLDAEEQAQLEQLAARAGMENRAVTEILVKEVWFV